MLSLITALTLAFPVIGPNVQMPDSLEVCILRAELCATEARLPICGGEVDAPDQQCISDYEDCSSPIPEAHEPACRVDYAWCRLESYAGYGEAKWCREVYETCPSIKFKLQW